MEVRRLEQRVDPVSNEVYIRSVFSPERKRAEGSDENEDDDEGEVGEAGEETVTQSKDLFDEDLVSFSCTVWVQSQSAGMLQVHT